MKLLGLFKTCRHKSLYDILPKISRRYSGDIQPEQTIQQESVQLVSDGSLIEFLESWKKEDEPDLREAVARDMQVVPNFVSVAEEASLLSELEPYLKRMRYEYDHWDNAIQGYRETERSKWSPQNEAILSRVKLLAFGPGSRDPLPHVHVLDLAAGGHIKPHVDAVRFCGDTIAGLCLLSSAVMRLVHERSPNLSLDALLQRRSLYIMRGVARYQFTHAVLGEAESIWRGKHVHRGRRIAVICRGRPLPVNTPTTE